MRPAARALLAPGADAAEMERPAHGHDADAMLLSPLDGEFHRLPADRLAVARLAVHHQHGARVREQVDLHVRPKLALLHRPDVARQHADAVAVMAGQVGINEIVGHIGRLVPGAPGGGADGARDGAQVLMANRGHGGGSVSGMRFGSGGATGFRRSTARLAAHSSPRTERSGGPGPIPDRFDPARRPGDGPRLKAGVTVVLRFGAQQDGFRGYSAARCSGKRRPRPSGAARPRSVMKPVTSRAGVTSKA